MQQNPSGHFETIYSSRGYPVKVWVRDMPRFDDSIIECVVYLYPSEAAAEDGQKIGGSGFICSVPLANEDSYIVSALPCVVTNRHVVESGNMVARINTRDGKTDVIALDGAEWFFHPDGDDLAVCPIGLNMMHEVTTIPITNGLNRNAAVGLDVGIGDDIVVPGRFINREGKQRNTPTLRFGNIAQMPIEPITLENGFKQEAFLAEVRTLSGYSGSPVFLYISPQPSLDNINPEFRQHIFRQFPGVRQKRQNMPMGFPPMLLGIAFSYIYCDEPVRSKKTGEPVHDYFIRSNTGMMGIVPAWKLTEIMFGETMAKPVEKARQELFDMSNENGVGLASAKPKKGDRKIDEMEENPSHAEDFSRLLGEAAQTPKSDD